MAEINFALNTDNAGLLADVRAKLDAILDDIAEAIAPDADDRTYATLYANNSRRVGVNPYGEYAQDVPYL